MTIPSEQLSLLRQNIIEYFNKDELRSLCFDLGIRYDDLEGDTISRKSLALVEYLNKRQRIPQLIDTLNELRPQVEWVLFFPFEKELEPPFKGLQFFTEQDAHLFFGREGTITALVDHLSNHRFLAVVGASGSGKSSVVRAGLVPALRRGQVFFAGSKSDEWPVYIITPGDEPLKTLAASLTRESESVKATAILLEDMRQNGQSLDLFLHRKLTNSNNPRLLLVVDQFEELFTQCDDLEERRGFVENLALATLSGKRGRLSLVLAMRADFYGYALQYEELRPLLESQQKILGPMSPAELRQAIEGPAGKEWHFQPGLIETILQDVVNEPGSLPLLSHSLLETWKRREGRTMTLAGYRAVGGVHGAIATSADAVYDSLTPGEQDTARDLFLRLTELCESSEDGLPSPDTRRRVPLVELVPQTETGRDVQSVLTRLVSARLVTMDETSAEVAHEALIRGWPRLRRWLEEDREALRLHRHLTEDALGWQALDRDPGALYRGARLALAEEWASSTQAQLDELETTFLIESRLALQAEERAREEERQQTRRAALFGLLGGGIVYPLVLRLAYSPQIQNQSLLNTFTLLWVLPGAVAGFLLVVLVDIGVSSYRGRYSWGQWLLGGVGGSVAFAFLLIYNTLLTTPGTDLAGRLLLAALQGSLWGFPSGLGRVWMLRTSKSAWQTLPQISLACGIALLIGQLFGQSFGEAPLWAVALSGALIPFVILGAANLSRIRR